MNLFPTYPLFNISLEKGKGCYVYDAKGKKYLDLYGGHAVISIGHDHPAYTKAIKKQAGKLGYYSNSVKLPIQYELAQKLGKLSKYPDYQLFLCNSGAEANENAIKLASFHTGRKLIVAFEGGFHGRTHGAVAVTDNPKIRAMVNSNEHVITLPFNDKDALKKVFAEKGMEIAAVIIEPIQGVAGIQIAKTGFMQLICRLCHQKGALLIADEVQAGYGRTGKFFSHQLMGAHPHLITMAKGMGNGFPVGGVLIHPDIKAWYGMLGTTFGGNPLACAASIAVLDVLKKEDLINNANALGKYLKEQLGELKQVNEVRGKGLMIGIVFEQPIKPIREELLYKYHILTGSSKDPNVLRILPPLNVKKKQLDVFLKALNKCLE